MIIHSDLIHFVALETESIDVVLQKIENNKHKIVYIVDENNHLLGCLADGDYRRWSLKQKKICLKKSINEIYNRSCVSMNVKSEIEDIEKLVNDTNHLIPLLDDNNHIVEIVEKGTSFVLINGRRISDEDPSYIIAEIGNNHQGDINLAKQLIDLAVAAKVDCIKFQMRTMSSLFSDDISEDSEDLGSQYVLDLLSKYQLNDGELYNVFDYCKSKGVTPLCTPWDLESLKKLEAYGMNAYKVASADFTNFQLLEKLAMTGKPLICSTGMSTDDEIRKTVQFLRRKRAQFVLLHCNSTYPAPFKDIHLNYLPVLKGITNGVIGYSGHERGWSVPIAAIAMGAKIIEKHFTIDTSLEGNDHKVSLLPDELSQMVREIRNVEKSLGVDCPRSITQGELMNREVLAKSLIANCSIQEGVVIEANMIDVISPGKGLQPNRIQELIGKKSNRLLSKGDVFFESDLQKQYKKKGCYSFSRPYGIPVRYHDFKALTSDVKLDFIEFHLSYKDMNLDVERFISKRDNIGFAVHAPELFDNDHLLDLSSGDESYRKQSIYELQRVVEHTRQLKKYFPKTHKPIIVVNIGGWNSENFLSKEEVSEKYRVVKESLRLLDTDGVELAIQTMPPFPWHFGGQSHHNLFVDADEIKEFCEAIKIKICLDVSHSMMACNYYKKDIYKFVETISPYIVHLHIVDAKGEDAEGIQIGEGDVDFRRLGKKLNDTCPGVQFIPEVWQGHNNSGEGFWMALDYLESHL